MGYDNLCGQAAEVNSTRYYCGAQRQTGVDSYLHYCAKGPKYLYYRREEGVKVAKPTTQNLNNPKSLEAVIPIVISALGTISKNANDWCGRLRLPCIFGSA